MTSRSRRRYAIVAATMALVPAMANATATASEYYASPQQPTSEDQVSDDQVTADPRQPYEQTQPQTSNDAVLAKLDEITSRLDSIQAKVAKIETQVIPYLQDFDVALISGPGSVVKSLNEQVKSLNQQVIPAINDKVLPRLYSLCEGQHQLDQLVESTDQRMYLEHKGFRPSRPGTPLHFGDTHLRDGRGWPWQYCWKALPSMGGAGPTG